MKLATLISGTFVSIFIAMGIPAYGQSPITLTTTNTQLSTSAFVLDSLSFFTFTNPAQGAAQTWNYGSGSILARYAEHFYASTDPAFSTSAIYDTIGFEPLVSKNATTYGITYHQVFDAGAGGITNPGLSFPSQAYNISGASGGPTDSLWVAAQDALYSPAITYLKLPATMGTDWSTTNAKRTVDMSVKVAELTAFGYPAVNDFKKVSYFTTTDSVVGWGNLTVPGMSAATPTLLLKVKTVRVDSFYLNNAVPASLILEGFNLAEGTVTTSYSYQFMAQGSILPLFVVDYSDPNYTQSKDYYSYQAAAAGVAQTAAATNGVHIFPNPAQSRTFFVQLDRVLTPGDRIEISDENGKMIQATQLSQSLNGTLVSVALPAATSSGTYFIRIVRESGAIETSKIELAP